MVQRDGADGLQIGIEHRIDDDSANALPSEVGEFFANRVGSLRQDRELDEADLGLALARQHPHQIGIMHRIERMIL